MPRLCLSLLLSLLMGSFASAVTMEWVEIGDPGNPGDAQPNCLGCGPQSVFGSVPYAYQISKYEVTTTQYAEFLNAVASSDPNGLYNPSISVPLHASLGPWILRDGTPGSYTYSVNPAEANNPIIGVSSYDAMRFANWMHNGQPAGVQDATTTEDGAYTFSGPTTAGPRNPGAQLFLPSEDEWYKAAYYDSSSMSYFDFPTGSNAPPTCSLPTTAPNTANCVGAGNYYGSDYGTVGVGGYPNSASPYGTRDQAGNVIEWTEAIFGPYRVLRGGHYASPPEQTASSNRDGTFPNVDAFADVGFRVAGAIPEPNTGLLVIAGLIGLAISRRHGS